MPPALRAAAALHVLLARDLTVAELPLSWSIGSDGALHAAPSYQAPEGPAAVRALAAALGVGTHESTLASKGDRSDLVVHLLYDAAIDGVPVFATAYLPVDVPAEDGAL
ncbi:hypothetical protein ACFVVU_23515 [Kitasatospora sp. NPDC057965]|uniref:hypothetical protein n=1 Tax=Kitasatospora sp. NPDC057965 TaxID=3346291 RepID=UPI0036DC4AD1